MRVPFLLCDALDARPGIMPSPPQADKPAPVRASEELRRYRWRFGVFRFDRSNEGLDKSASKPAGVIRMFKALTGRLVRMRSSLGRGGYSCENLVVAESL